MIVAKLRSLRWVLPVLALLAVITNLQYHVTTSHPPPPPPAAPNVQTVNSTKTILMYTPYFHMKDWEFGLGQEPFVRHNCPVTNCFVTNDRRHLPHYGDYDAILFHIRDLKDFPEQRTRRPEQVYVMFLMESPLNSANFPYSHFDDVFNWTMTYRSDSDVRSPYGWVAPMDDPTKGPWESDLTDKPPPGTEKLTSLIRGKTKQVAWIVTNCDTHSQREDYVDELRKHISVDVFGKCGKHKCNEDGPENCFKQIQADYKFYLSFENSWCKDYVTEKFWNALNSSMVPVVLGGADYDSLAPPNSFIDASKYTPKELAALLKKLDKDDEELTKYLAWKTRYMVSPVDTNHYRFCDLCRRLNQQPMETIVYSDIQGWWDGSQICRKKGTFPWSKPDSLAKLLRKSLQSVFG